MHLFFIELWISSRRFRGDPILAMPIEQGVCKVVPVVIGERILIFCARVCIVRCMGDLCHDHPSKDPVTLITPTIVCDTSPKGHIVEGIIREFFKENSGKLNHLLSMKYTRLAKRQKLGSWEWRYILKYMSTLRKRRPIFPFLV